MLLFTSNICRLFRLVNRCHFFTWKSALQCLVFLLLLLRKTNTMASQPLTLMTDFDIELFRSGNHYKLYEKMGAFPKEEAGVAGTYFCVWAPSAAAVEVIGDWNHWSGHEDQLFVRWDSSGVWEGFVPGAKAGDRYKYRIRSKIGGQVLDKADPYAKRSEIPPKTASIIADLQYKWKDKTWMKNRTQHNALDKPYAVYEVHLGSWMHDATGKSITYKEMASKLVTYVKDMGFTHVELLPIMAFPYEPSWGYQVTGYFAATERYGSTEDLMALIDAFHKADIGVILDWVPAHFPSDAHALASFDGSHLYEHPDPRKGYHPDWESLIFNYERPEVKSFLISSALYWLEAFHIDALRVDAVASMLYLDYSRDDGGWEPNAFGGRENLGAIAFLKDFNQAVYTHFEGVQTIAEESTAYPMVSRPVDHGGLGFGMKWMMGWMHDTLRYFQREPIYRQYHHFDLSFALTYAFTENFMLPLSHDEVVHGKNPLIYKMPGDEWQRFANLRTLYTYMWTHPGTKLLFMGGELAQTREWNFRGQLDWHLLEYPVHQGVQSMVKALNQLYTTEAALHAKSFEPEGFTWIAYDDSKNCVLSYLRKAPDEKSIAVVLNMTPVAHKGYTIGVNGGGNWSIVFNSDDEAFGGSGYEMPKAFKAVKKASHNMDYSLTIDIPPLAGILLKPNKMPPKPKAKRKMVEKI